MSESGRDAERFREALVSFLRRELVGPSAPEEWLIESPCHRYSAGMLFPVDQANADEDDDEEDKVAVGPIAKTPQYGQELHPLEDDRDANSPLDDGNDAAYDDSLLLANARSPSAMGLSFVVGQGVEEVSVDVCAATYERELRRIAGKDDKVHEINGWRRLQLDIPRQTLGTQKELHEETLHEGLRLRLVSRAFHGGGRLVTIAIYNTRTASNRAARPDECFFQVGFSATGRAASPAFVEYRPGVLPNADIEDRSLELLYRNHKVFGVGHGCAADWEGESGNTAKCVSTATVPSHYARPIGPRGGTAPHLSMELLSGKDSEERDTRIPAALEALAGEYDRWIDELGEQADELPPGLVGPALNHIAQCRNVAARIRAGIQLLRRNEFAMQAFCDANRAMLMQQHHNLRARRRPGEPWVDLPTEYTSSQDPERPLGYWRSFQLAFVLMNLRPFVPGSRGDDVDVVDLIWFPTGGGKTEAYLGLAAYAIFMRRRLAPASVGSTVLMRYTLRLLTAQQFQRAAALITACEMIRRADPSVYGDGPIGVGLWVGRSLSPNKRDEARRRCDDLHRKSKSRAYRSARRRRMRHPFQLPTCPACGTALDDVTRLGFQVVALRNKTVRFVCPEPQCAFSRPEAPIPVCVVDEDLYETPPDLLIGTVDKFAMLAWVEEAGRLFGLGVKNGKAPSLIIQDELHLISGPLGSMVGLYESAVEQLCSHGGERPKIVASTATIRRAKDQVAALYRRPVCQFPPPGLDAAESFFGGTDTKAPSRVYAGVLPAAAQSPGKAQVRVVAALLQGAKSVPVPDGASENARDPYWTLVQYYGSLRELGRGASLLEADVPEYIDTMCRRGTVEWGERRWAAYIELTGRRTAEEIPDLIEDLKLAYPSKERAPVDSVLATNMISVGIDIDRLGLMLVVGQPRTTSEYIQASSRVGRSKRAPGLVVTLFSPSRPRDRSHYEGFRGFHDAFYKHVEPTSVTPFSLPVLDRGLPALLVIGARHLAGLRECSRFDQNDPVLRDYVDHLVARAEAMGDERRQLVRRLLADYMRAWAQRRPAQWGRPYWRPEVDALLAPAGASLETGLPGTALWEAPTSLRSVDAECGAQPLVSYIASGES